jgi:DNA-binding transcriptional LysR family regulator
MADRRLQVFHAVTKQRSFTKAAEVLFMSQGGVAFQIKQLEEQLNARLFDRGHQPIVLTEAGELVLEYTERILGLSAEMDGCLGEMTSEIGGQLLVGASTTIAEFMLPRILCEFKSKYPDVKTRLVVANSETIETRVAEHTLDIGLIESSSHRPNLQNDICCDDELQVVCSPTFPLAKFRELTAQQLVDQPYISREPGSGTREYADAYLREHGVIVESLKLVMELGSPEAVNGVVEMGLGFAIGPRTTVARAQRSGDLVAIPLKPKLIRTLSMVYPKKKVRSRLVDAFVEFASARLGQC